MLDPKLCQSSLVIGKQENDIWFELVERLEAFKTSSPDYVQHDVITPFAADVMDFDCFKVLFEAECKQFLSLKHMRLSEPLKCASDGSPPTDDMWDDAFAEFTDELVTWRKLVRGTVEALLPDEEINAEDATVEPLSRATCVFSYVQTEEELKRKRRRWQQRMAIETTERFVVSSHNHRNGP